jgi:hypothetical protein
VPALALVELGGTAQTAEFALKRSEDLCQQIGRSEGVKYRSSEKAGPSRHPFDPVLLRPPRHRLALYTGN